LEKKVTRAALWIVLSAALARAEVVDRKSTIDGMTVEYQVVLPRDYASGRSYPGVLVFGGGSQTFQAVRTEVERTWRPEAEQRGYIVVMPAAPEGQLFFEGGSRVFPRFVELLLSEYRIEPGKLHIAGHSNGGISAFHIASTYPQYFRTITGFPGYLTDDLVKAGGIDRIKSMCIFFHVGQRDIVWRSVLDEQFERFTDLGMKVRFHVEPREDHLIQALQGTGVKRLFDQFETCP
jgi:predicted peptidase